MVTIAVPILNRPERIEAVMGHFEGFDVLFLPDRTDTESILELERTGAHYSLAPTVKAFGVPTYASKVNHAYRVTDSPFLLYGSDDIHPEPGWWDKALVSLRDESIGLLGVYDGVRPYARHQVVATHGIVRRSYVERYGSASLKDAGPIFWEGYRHACVDVEVTGVANARRAYRFNPKVVFKHDRPNDSTMQLGGSFLEEDRERMYVRQGIWTGQ